MRLYVCQVDYPGFDILFRDCEIADNFALSGGVVHIKDPDGKEVARRSLTFEVCDISSNSALVRSIY